MSAKVKHRTWIILYVYEGVWTIHHTMYPSKRSAMAVADWKSRHKLSGWENVEVRSATVTWR